MKRLSMPRGAMVASLIAATLATAAPRARGSDEPAAWDFTLPTLDGDRFVQASRTRGFALVNFWGRDCPPCVAELPRLQAFARGRSDWTLLLVATDPVPEARAFLLRHDISLPVLRPGQNVESLMRRAGNRTGGLPYTVALRDGRLCATHAGELSDASLAAMRTACGDGAVASPGDKVP